MRPSTDAFFLPAAGGQRFCLHHRPAGAPRGALLYVHPFAEEMNKARRMAAVQSRALADAGYEVLQVDLLGCGDSSGDFGDATWQDWVDDVVRAASWLQRRSSAPLALWGLRAGCLLAAQAAQCLDAGGRLVFWQPPAGGKVLLQQFLRLKMAAQLEAGGGKGVVEGLKQQLAAGLAVEVAGYALNPRLADGFGAATLAAPWPAAPAGAEGVRRIVWCEISNREPANVLPASATVIAALEEAGCAVQTRMVAGPAFWQTTEIEEAPALLQHTLDGAGWAFQ